MPAPRNADPVGWRTTQGVTASAGTATAWISRVALRAMEDEAAAHPTTESGGLLMGYWASGAVVITTVVGPGPNALHDPDRYVPDHDFHEQEVARLQAATGAALRYLGDWHSHPAGVLRLSRRDRRTLRRIATSPEADVPTPLMAILAAGQAIGGTWNLGVWQGRMERRYRLYNKLSLRQLVVRAYGEPDP